MKKTRGQKQGPKETQTDLRGMARSSLKPTKMARVSKETLLVRTASRRRRQSKTSLEMNGRFQRRLRQQRGCRRGHQPLPAEHRETAAEMEMRKKSSVDSQPSTRRSKPCVNL
ncbi:hypothetical protein TGDOM2_361680 [Toxoplasma gondii GAB2-2007-GAL-DOM2]|uniref:Uncharacterized protein n=2 Tax=Toxoplasma gondii TaxID=5811 RepID=A0A086JSL8_TOXGO|nr:hypothetical protein TGP89_361680 [Toxoplasma gondii p89]KFG35136.1 hypothetical protein TGDOM2_361680 [Toxoplasma gondii GAB2-2007-GAL-DOM2]